MPAVLPTARRSSSSTLRTGPTHGSLARRPIQLAAVRKLAPTKVLATSMAIVDTKASGLRRLRHAAEVTGSAIMLLGFLVLALFG